ncbi:hypothetical protein M231_08014, partial [Tremella mesenterica]
TSDHGDIRARRKDSWKVYEDDESHHPDEADWSGSDPIDEESDCPYGSDNGDGRRYDGREQEKLCSQHHVLGVQQSGEQEDDDEFEGDEEMDKVDFSPSIPIDESTRDLSVLQRGYENMDISVSSHLDSQYMNPSYQDDFSDDLPTVWAENPVHTSFATVTLTDSPQRQTREGMSL